MSFCDGLRLSEAWTQGGDREAGSWEQDAVQMGITDILSRHSANNYLNKTPVVSGAVTEKLNGIPTAVLSLAGSGLEMTTYHVNQRTAGETRPANIAVPLAIYLGIPA